MGWFDLDASKIDSNLATALGEYTVDGLTPENYEKVVLQLTGYNDGPDWHWIVKSTDAYFYIKAGCDYTGWG